MKVRIKDYEYKITETNDKTDTEFWNKERGELILFGSCNNVSCEIKIWKDVSETQKRKTLVHELTHAFLFVYWGSYNLKEKYDNEDMCCFVETYAEDILKITNEYFLEKSSRFLIEKVEAIEKTHSKKKK